jgi:hypothetical protein
MVVGPCLEEGLESGGSGSFYFGFADFCHLLTAVWPVSSVSVDDADHGDRVIEGCTSYPESLLYRFFGNFLNSRMSTRRYGTVSLTVVDEISVGQEVL